MGLKIGGQVEKVNGKELSYSEFVERYLVKNQPVVLTGLMHDWRACKDWVFEEHGRPNLSFFSTHFGNSRVQVAECATRDFTDQKRVDMSVLEFIDHWLQLYSNDCSNSSINECFDNSLLYLKDWHFVKEYPEYLAYKTPLFFCDDWLNLYLDKYRMHMMDSDFDQGRNEISCSDYRFVYMGAKGTWTPLHADVFRSYSWSSNVCGKKQWYFLHPSQHHLVFDRNMKNSVYDILGEVSETKFPGFSKAIWWECTQNQNEIIFVPSGWYHQVHNLWDLLLKDYNEAKEYIEDIKDICDDFEQLCQRNLAANTAIRSIALKMESTGLMENHRNRVNLLKTIEDPAFMELCTALERTYKMIYEKCEVGHDMKQGLANYLDLDFTAASAHVSSPKDLVKCIDDAITKLRSITVNIKGVEAE